jgi:CheY-like chemotaxis protein
MHGGSVSAASDGANRGSTFTVSLPLLEDERNSTKTEPRTAAAEDSLALELKDVSVLVVDDERDARGLIKRVLEEHGARVTMCGSGAEAIQLVPTVRPDVLVSDIGMPQMDGYEMLRRVRELGAARRGDVPAIAVSALARSEDRSRALREGFSVYVAKPVEPYELVATVARIRNGETALKGSRIS